MTLPHKWTRSWVETEFEMFGSTRIVDQYNKLRRGYAELQNAITELATHGAKSTSIVVVSGPDRHEVICRFVTTHDAHSFHQSLRKCGDAANGLTARD